MAVLVSALKTEIDTDPLNRGYSGMTDNQVADDLNAKYRNKTMPISMRSLREWAGGNARALKVNQAISDVALPDNIRNIALVADRLLGVDEGQVELDNPLHIGMINALVSAGIIDAADRTALQDKAQVTISRAEELGMEAIQEKHVRWARQ